MDISLFLAMLWIAPEILREITQVNETSFICNGTRKGDVYSFAIIVQEILYRSGPFYIQTEVADLKGYYCSDFLLIANFHTT
jgi:serine/threonine protein kinase